MPSDVYDILGKKIDKYEHSIFDYAQDLHMSLTGSADPLHPKEALKIYYFLLNRLNDWQCGIDRFSGFDNAVKELIKAVLSEYELDDLHRDLDWMERNK